MCIPEKYNILLYQKVLGGGWPRLIDSDAMAVPIAIFEYLDINIVTHGTINWLVVTSIKSFIAIHIFFQI